MRKLSVIITFVLLLAFLSVPVKSSPDESYGVGIVRAVTVGEWGTVVFNDTLRITNSGTIALSSINYGLPRSMATNLRAIIAKDSSGSKLNIETDVEQSSPYYWTKVYLRDAVSPKGTGTLHVSSAYSNLVTFQKAVAVNSQDKFMVSVTILPTLKATVSSSNVTIYAISDAQFEVPADSGFTSTKIGGVPALDMRLVSAPVMTDKQLSFNFTSSTQGLIRCDWAKRDLEITSHGDLQIRDSYQITNLGRDITSVKINLPKDASGAMLYDDLGVLSNIPFTEASVAPRFRTLRQNEAMAFNIDYKVPAGKAVDQLQWWGYYNLNFDLLSNIQWIVEKAEIVISIPQGLNVEQIQPKPTQTSSGIYRSQLSYVLGSATPLDDLKLSIKYRYSPFWAALMPMIWMSVVVVGLAAVQFGFKRRGPSQIVSEVPVDAIRRFVELYDERSALRLELDKISQELTRGAISRHEHRRRSSQIEARTDVIRRELQPLRPLLTKASPRFGEMITRLERAEAEMDSARSSESQLRSQYRSGRVSRSVYDEMSTQTRRRHDHARETINSTIIALREETR